MKWRKTKKAAKVACRRMRAADDVDRFITASKQAAAAMKAAGEAMARLGDGFRKAAGRG